MTQRANCKIVLLGKESTGKSCLVRRFTDNEFDPTCFASTVGASYAAKKVETSLGEVVISLWDTAGQEKFDSLTRLYYNGASAALICVDLTDGTSYTKAQYWVKELRKHQPACTCYIVVTKTDLLDPPAVAATPAGLLPQVPACLATERASSSTAQAATECGIPPDSTVRKLGGGSSRKESPSPTTPLDRQSKSTDRPSSLSSSSAQASTPKAVSVASSSWKSGASTRGSASSSTRRKEVADSQLKSLAQSMGAKICRTSSATGEGITELFRQVAEDLAPALAKEVEEQQARMGQERCLLDEGRDSGLFADKSVEDPAPVQLCPTESKPQKASCCF